MVKRRGLNKPVLIASSVVAILATAVGGSWRISTSTPPNWKIYIQLPGYFVASSAGFFLPLIFLSSPPVVSMLTILINASCYYALLRAALFIRRKLKSDSISD